MGNLFVEMIAVAFLSWGWMWRSPFEEFQREDPGKSTTSRPARRKRVSLPDSLLSPGHGLQE